MSQGLKRQFLTSSVAALVTLLLTSTAGLVGTAHAQSATPIKFQLDWRFEGPAAFFLAPVAKGYFKDAKLDVTVDAGNGSGGAVASAAMRPPERTDILMKTHNGRTV